MRWFRRKKYYGPMSKEKIMEGLKVDKENPLLLSVLALMRGIQEGDAAMQYIPKMAGEERSFYAGRCAALEDTQQTIIDLVEKANQRAKL